jgi:ribose-phosphate pyrophosphokinase
LKYLAPVLRDGMKVVAGSASLALGKELARAIRADLVDVAFEKHPGGFPDGERYVRLLASVAGEDVVLVQSTFPDAKIVELFLLQDALAEGGARRVTLVIPYFGYGRQDKKFEAGEPVSARALARRLQIHADAVVTVSVHNPTVLSFFEVPAREVSGMPAIARYLRGKDVDLVLAPDANAERFAAEVGGALGVGTEFLEKKRIDSFTVETEPKALAVRGKSVAIVDDVISTGTTIATAAKMLREQGAKRVVAACVHGLFSSNALTRLRACDEVVATDTLLSPATKVSVAPEIAAVLRP